MPGPNFIVKLALIASAALALPFDLQEFSHQHYAPGANPPFPQYNPAAGDFPHGGMPVPTGTAPFIIPTGTSAPTGIMKRDAFPPHMPPPSGFVPSGGMPQPTGFWKEKRMMMPTGTGGFPAPTGGFHDFMAPVPGPIHARQPHQFAGPRKPDFKPFFGAPSPEMMPFPTCTMPPMPTAT